MEVGYVMGGHILAGTSHKATFADGASHMVLGQKKSASYGA